MKELFSQKIKIFIVLVIVIAVGLAFFAKKYEVRRGNISKKMVVKLQEMEKALTKKESPRKEENLALKNLIVVLNQKHKDIISLSVKKREELPGFAPLEFKEELLKVQTILKENASFPLPEGIGFHEYIGGVIPEQKDIHELTRQLYIIKELVELLIKAKVRRIEEINRDFDSRENMVYKSYLFRFKFSADMDNLIKFLVDLQKSKDFIVVHNINIMNLPNLRLIVDMAVKVIDFKE